MRGCHIKEFCDTTNIYTLKVTSLFIRLCYSPFYLLGHRDNFVSDTWIQNFVGPTWRMN